MFNFSFEWAWMSFFCAEAKNFINRAKIEHCSKKTIAEIISNQYTLLKYPIMASDILRVNLINLSS